MAFHFSPLAIPGPIRAVPDVYEDSRGFFHEGYRSRAFVEAGIDVRFVQMNRSRSSKGVVRGLHYQLPPADQGKLVSVVRGAAYDVVVDIRRGSPWFGQHVSVDLNEDDGSMLWVPPGFAHGFCAISGPTDLLYLMTAEYSPANERGIDALDPAIGVAWPVPEDRIIRSDKDAELPTLDQAETGFRYEE